MEGGILVGAVALQKNPSCWFLLCLLLLLRN